MVDGIANTLDKFRQSSLVVLRHCITCGAPIRLTGHTGEATGPARAGRYLVDVGAQRPIERLGVRHKVATLVAMTVGGPMALRDVKNHLSEVVDQVEREHDRVVITKHGKPAAVVISVDDLTSLEETLEIAGRPRLMEQIRDSLGELAAGEAEVLTKDALLASLRS